MSENFDIAIVGAGMAGASLAAELAPHAKVLLLEAEDRPGYHSTGRSAAFWVESYGGPPIQPLTTASGPWLADHGFLSPRGGLSIARARDGEKVEGLIAELAGAGVRHERLDRANLEAIIPGLRQDWIEGVLEPDCRDIDVAGLHGWYLAEASRAGAELRCRAALASATRACGRWTLATADGRQVECETLVNAAGAWADPVAQLAGVRPIGIAPKRRTIVQLRTAPEPPPLPLVLDIGGDFYFKPESGRLWLSPHDETPSPPCDAAPEEIDIALAIERLGTVVDWQVERVEHKWAGLRSFAPDRIPVYGPDPREPGFFWFAGQGGYGIQTAPAAARLAAQILLGLSSDGLTSAIDGERYLASRFG